MVSVTLPERILALLQRLHPDRSKAIVKAVETAAADPRNCGVEVVDAGNGAGIILVPAMRSLDGFPWLRMVEVAPMRNLLTIDSGTAIEKIELSLGDLLESCRKSHPDEVPLLEQLQSLFSHHRRSQQLSKAEMLLVAGRG